jgi:hypothetical protein
MHGIGYFQNLRNFLRNCLEVFGFFWDLIKNFWGIFGRIFFGGVFWEEFLRRNSMGGFLCLLTLLKSGLLFE